MMRIAMAVAVVLMACGGSDSERPSPCAADVSHVETGADGAVTCQWQCATKAGHPVVLAWERYEWTGSGYVLASSETLVGICVASQ